MYDFADDIPNMHSGYHYSSTAIEWKYLLDAVREFQEGNAFTPKVSLDDGIRAVEMGISAMNNISNDGKSKCNNAPVTAFSSKSSENLLDLVLNSTMVINKDHMKEAFMRVIDACDGEYKVNVP